MMMGRLWKWVFFVSIVRNVLVMCVVKFLVSIMLLSLWVLRCFVVVLIESVFIMLMCLLSVIESVGYVLL